MFIRYLAALGLFVLAAGAVAAQSGGIEIRVVDSDGAPLPGATVTISHETGHVKATAQLTDGAGMTVFPVLRAGAGYSIVVESPGFSAMRHDRLRVRTGRVESVSVQMLDDLQETVTVRTERQVIELETSQASTKFSEEFISDLPVPGRFYQNVLTMTPGVNDADGDGNPNVHGSRNRDFSAMVNGVRNVDPLTGQWMSRVNPNSIEEMEVITAGAGVEFGRAQGGFARIIQKQGNNSLEGTFDFIYRTSKLDGTGARDIDNTSDPDFQWFQPGFQISGPIIRDKLWFFVAHERINREDPVNITTGIEVTTTEAWTHSDRLTWQVSPRNKLSFQFQSDPLEIDNLGVSSSRPSESSLAIERTGEIYTMTWTAPYSPRILVESTLSWQDLNTTRKPSDPESLNSCFAGQGFVVTAQCTDVATGEITGAFPRTDDDHRQRLTVSGQATVFGGRFWGMSHQFKFGVGVENERYFRSLTQKPTVDKSIVGILEPRPPQFFALGLYRVAIPETDDVRATGTNWSLYAEDQFRPAQNLTMTLGLRVDREELVSEGRTPVDTIGEFEAYAAQIEPFSDQPDSIIQFIAGSLFPSSFTGYEDYGFFEREMQNIICEGRLPSAVGACKTDVSQNILNQRQLELESVRRAQDLEIQNTNFSPFLSLAWSPWSNGKTAFKAAVGRHYNNIPLIVPLQELEPLLTDLVYRSDLSSCDPISGCQARLDGGIEPAITVRTVDPNLRTPYQDELTLAVERELWTETSISLRYIRRKFEDQIQDVNVNLNTGDFGRCRRQQDLGDPTIIRSPGSGFEITDPFTGEVFVDTDPGNGDGRLDDCVGVNTQVNPMPNNSIGDGSETFTLQRPDGIQDLYVQSPFWGDIFVIGNFNRVDYEAVQLELIRRQFRSWEMQASYTWSEAIGDGEDFFQELGDDPSLQRNVRGNQSYDQRHAVRFTATTVTPWGFRVGTFITWQSGLPYSILLQESSLDAIPIVTDNLGDPSLRARQTYPTGTRNDQRNASFWNVDLRVAKEFNAGRGLNVQLSAEVFNLLNDGTYQIYDPVFERGQNLNGVNLDEQFRFGRRWQLGMKLSF